MLYQLQDKLDALIKAYQQEKEAHRALQEKCDRYAQKMEEQSTEIAELKEALLVKNLGKNADSEALKKYIDGIIAEIDQTIKTL